MFNEFIKEPWIIDKNRNKIYILHCTNLPKEKFEDIKRYSEDVKPEKTEHTMVFFLSAHSLPIYIENPIHKFHQKVNSQCLLVFFLLTIILPLHFSKQLSDYVFGISNDCLWI